MQGDEVLTPEQAGHRHHQTVAKGALAMWTVTKPHDYPGKYAARLFIIQAGVFGPSPYVVVGDTLEALRKRLPVGLLRLPRNPQDPPVVVEVWM